MPEHNFTPNFAANQELNRRQVGGQHYRNGDKVQHWDLAIMYDWDPFQYQITKYIMRWKDKYATPEQRLVDLQKGFHFYEKYLANWAAFDKTATRLEAAHIQVLPRDEDDWQAEYEEQMDAMTYFQPDGYRIDKGERGDQEPKKINGYQCVWCRKVTWSGSPLGALRTHGRGCKPLPPTPLLSTAS